jgi:hypothetical protein
LRATRRLGSAEPARRRCGGPSAQPEGTKTAAAGTHLTHSVTLKTVTVGAQVPVSHDCLALACALLHLGQGSAAQVAQPNGPDEELDGASRGTGPRASEECWRLYLEQRTTSPVFALGRRDANPPLAAFFLLRRRGAPTRDEVRAALS